VNQPTLFSDNACVWCGHGEASPKNPLLWNGFLDKDTGELVCMDCKSFHYYMKQEKRRKQGIEGMTYSEFPVYNRNNQINLTEGAGTSPAKE